MKITKTEITYTDDGSLGKIAFCIDLSDSGVEVPVDDILNQSANIDRFVIKGNLHEQQYDLKKLITKSKDKLFELYISTNHRIKFPYSNRYFILLTNETTDEVVAHYINIENNKFVMYVSSMDELYTADLLIKDKGVSKKNSLLILKTIDEELIRSCKVMGYDINIKMSEILGAAW